MLKDNWLNYAAFRASNLTNFDEGNKWPGAEEEPPRQ
jgi:hypothetical protein